MLISTTQINTLAFLTPLDVSYFKTNIMYSVQEKDLRLIMGDTLLDAVLSDTVSYPILIESYIKPYLAFQIKYYTLILLYSDITVDSDYTNLENAIAQANLIARQNKTLLQNYIYTTYGVLPTSVNGFTIPQSIIQSNLLTTMPQSDVEDIAPSLFTADTGQTTFTLPQLMKRSSLVFVNDSFVSPSKYTGIGTLLLVFNTALDKYDKVLITF